ncbi:hypothetical protein JKP88DRAFT_266164 [Tribonema minus]|uniref:Uncharacterized protein n=1 Tax=Tribonema minus TaxID=303371 RepID=A0A835ZHV7_9STRA|nr:hypothetical protein JKP88DRAFT_266164 [Tribonema minus]
MPKVSSKTHRNDAQQKLTLVRALRGELAKSKAAHAVCKKRLRRYEVQMREHFDFQRQDASPFTVLLEHQPGLLNTVFTFLGPGHWLYVAGISRGVRGIYLAAIAAANGVYKTTFKAALATTATLDLAVQARVYANSRALSLVAGEYAPLRVLEHARATIGDFIEGAPLSRGAARRSRLDVLVWQRQHFGGGGAALLGDAALSAVLREAAARGDTDVLGWAWAQAVAADADVDAAPLCAAAARGGHLRALQWLLATCPLTGEPARPVLRSPLLRAAAGGGHRHVMRWLEDALEVLVGADAVYAAAGGGQWELALELMARPVGGVTMDGLCHALLTGKSTEAHQLRWARERGGGDWSAAGRTDMLGRAMQAGNLAMADYLIAEGAQWPPCLAGPDHKLLYPLPVLQFAIARGCPWRNWSAAVCARLRSGGGAAGGRRAAAAAAAALAWAHAAGAPCHCDFTDSESEEDASEDEGV